MAQEEKNGSPATGSAVTIGNTELVQYLALRAAEIVDSKVREREDRRNKMMSFTVAFLSVLGLSGIFAILKVGLNEEFEKRFSAYEAENKEQAEQFRGVITSGIKDMERQLPEIDEKLQRGLRGQSESIQSIASLQQKELDRIEPLLEQKMDQRARQAVSNEVGPMSTELRTAITLQTLTNMALGLELKDSFSAEERDATVALIRELSSSEVLNRREFLPVIEKIVDAFHSAGQLSHIDEIDAALGSALTRSPGIVFTLVDHYGQRVVGSAKVPNDDTMRFEKYSRAARRGEAEALSLLWELLVESKRDGEASEAVSRLLESATFLDIQAKTQLLAGLFQYCHPSVWTENVTYEARQIADTCRKLTTGHSQTLRDMQANMPTEGLQMMLVRMIEQGQENDPEFLQQVDGSWILLLSDEEEDDRPELETK